MAKLLNRSRVLLCLQNLNYRSKYLITLFFIFLIGFVFLFVFYIPLRSDIKNVQKLYEQSFDLNNSYKSKIKATMDLERENTFLNSYFGDFFKKNIDIEFVLDFFDKNSLYCKQFNCYKTNEKYFINKKYYSLDIKGEFESLIGLLKCFETNKIYSKFKSFNLVKKKNNKVLISLNFVLLSFYEN